MGVQYTRENVAGGARIDVAVLPAPSHRSPPFGLSEGKKFTVEEVCKLSELLNLSSALVQEIFFERELA